MNKLTLIAPFVACLALAGCGNGTTVGISVSAVQADAQAACKFLPDAQAVANLISGANPAVDTAAAAAAAICKAVDSPPTESRHMASANGKITVTVNGVAVSGVKQ